MVSGTRRGNAHERTSFTSHPHHHSCARPALTAEADPTADRPPNLSQSLRHTPRPTSYVVGTWNQTLVRCQGCLLPVNRPSCCLACTCCPATISASRRMARFSHHTNVLSVTDKLPLVKTPRATNGILPTSRVICACPTTPGILLHRGCRLPSAAVSGP